MSPDASSFPTITDTVTQDAIDAYAELSTDFNPLHVDPEAAAASEFGGIIAHGPIALHAFFRAATGTLTRRCPRARASASPTVRRPAPATGSPACCASPRRPSRGATS